ncbi:MAG: metallophosphoesterase family protein [Chloroflexi bacterium]|nr:metallophosphoesterase family protein [Chloroflexota bacterium]
MTSRLMRIGLFSDIHGNLTALRAVDAALAREAPLDHVIVAGDHLQGGPRPLEVWQFLTSRGWALIRGNEDDALVAPDLEPRLPDSPSYRQAFIAQVEWTRQRLGPAILEQLAALPDRWRIATPAGDLLVVHASPRAIDDRAGGAHNTAAEVTAAYAGTGASAIAFGHYHRSFVRPMPFALLINVASVGLPFDHRPLAAYTILTATADGWIVEQRSVPYDAAEERAAAEATGMPPWVPDHT